MKLALSTSALVQNSGCIHRETGWVEVARGLTFILRGYLLLTVATLTGLGLVVWCQYSELLSALPAPDADERMAWQAAGVLLLLLAPIAGCILVLAGQWRCLGHAPERHGAKALMYACLNCLVLSVVVGGAALVASAAEQPNGPEQLWSEWGRFEFSLTTKIAQVTSVVVVVSCMLLFTLFLRAVAACFRDERRVRHIERFFLFTSFLLGGTVFVFLGSRHLSGQPEFLLGLSGCWLISILWHFGLVWSSRACIRANQARLRPPVTA
jgi:hypothetical protein